MGRSRGGLTTKIHALVDANGNPIALKLTEGQAHDGKSAGDMLDHLGAGQTLLADRAYDSDGLRQSLGCTQNAAAIRSLVHPSNDNRMARARSASSRSRDPARPRNSALCSDVDSIHDCPDMISPHAVALPWGFCHMWIRAQRAASGIRS
jgi:transposase